MISIHPNSASLRQWQRREVARTGFADGRARLTLSGFLSACGDAARRAGLLAAESGGRTLPLQPMGDIERAVVLMAATETFRAGRGRKHPAFNGLPPLAIQETLAHLDAYLSPLAGLVPDAVTALQGMGDKCAWLADVYAHFDAACVDRGFATEARVNEAILTLLQGPRDAWPAFLREADGVEFLGVRWLPPFVERVVQALDRGLGKGNVTIHYILQEHEQDWWAGRIMGPAGLCIFGGEAEMKEGGAYYPPPVLNHLTGLREAVAMKDPGLAAEVTGRVGFSTSVGVYGEVEDLARRIAWLTTREKDALKPSEIGLVARHLGDYSDAITDVFTRFGIPYYFRRGIPVLSTAVAKAVMGLLELQVSRSRDGFCALLESPWLNWWAFLGGEENHWILRPEALADDIRRAGVEARLPDAESLGRRLETYYESRRGRRPANIAERIAAARQALMAVFSAPSPASARDGIADLLSRSRAFRVEDRVAHFARTSAGTPLDKTYLLNARALAALKDALAGVAKAGGQFPCSGWRELSALLNRLLANMTVADPSSTEDGVWVMNPFDMGGLSFKAVLVVGLNSGRFPILPEQNPVFSDADLAALREKLGKSLPATALAPSQARACQENLLLLSILAAAQDTLVFSRLAFDENGEPVPASVYYSVFWRLAGWPALGAPLPAQPPDPYDQWRLNAAGDWLGPHWKKQSKEKGFRRRPFPGESLFGLVPPALCRSADEARQTAAGSGRAFGPGRRAGDAIPSPAAVSAARGLRVEKDRDRVYRALNAAEPDPKSVDSLVSLHGRLAGVIPADILGEFRMALADGAVDLSPSALETLVTCPFRFLMEYVLRADELRLSGLEADVMDRGTVVHGILSAGFKMLQGRSPAEGEEDFAGAPARAALRKKYGALFSPVRIGRRDDTWVILPGKPGPADLAGVELKESREQEYLEFFGDLADAFRETFRSGVTPWKLGHPGQTDIEWAWIRRTVRNVVRAQLATQGDGFSGGGATGLLAGLTRCAVWIEQEFRGAPGSVPEGKVASVEISDPAHGILRLHGWIDRVDLFFESEGERRLRGLLVIDYKGKGQTSPELAEGIVSGTICQLPVYAMAAARHFTGENCPDDLPVLMQYYPYNTSVAKIQKGLEVGWIDMTGRPLSPEALGEFVKDPGEGMMGSFRRRLFRCLDTLKSGRFLVQSLDCGYCKVANACRYRQPGLEDKGGDE